MFKLTVKCPNCGRHYVESEKHQFKGVCSERCSIELEQYKKSESLLSEIVSGSEKSR